MFRAWAMPLIFISLYILPIFGFSWLLTRWVLRRHPRWPRSLLLLLFMLIGLALAPIPDHGDFELLGWKIWKNFQGSP